MGLILPLKNKKTQNGIKNNLNIRTNGVNVLFPGESNKELIRSLEILCVFKLLGYIFVNILFFISGYIIGKY